MFGIKRNDAVRNAIDKFILLGVEAVIKMADCKRMKVFTINA